MKSFGQLFTMASSSRMCKKMGFLFYSVVIRSLESSKYTLCA